MNKNESRAIAEVRCIKCGEYNTVKKAPNRIKYRYSIHCDKCGHGGVFTQRLFDYAKQHDGCFPQLESG